MTPGTDHGRDDLANLDVNSPALQPGSRVKKLLPSTSKLGGAVPVRFRPDTIEAVKRVADRDGVSVSAWIRCEVEEAVRRDESAVSRSNVYTLRPLTVTVTAAFAADSRRHMLGAAV